MKSICLNKTNINDVNRFIRNLANFKFAHISSIKNGMSFDFQENFDGNSRYVITLENVKEWSIDNFSSNVLLKYEFRYGASQTESLAIRLNDKEVLEYPQLLIWCADDQVMPKISIVFEKAEIKNFLNRIE